MRFTRFSSDGDSVVEERIWMRLQVKEQHRAPKKEELLETHSFADSKKETARAADGCRVLAGIDQLLRSTATAA